MLVDIEVGLGSLVSKILIFVQFYMYVNGNDCYFDSWFVFIRYTMYQYYGTSLSIGKTTPSNQSYS